MFSVCNPVFLQTTFSHKFFVVCLFFKGHFTEKKFFADIFNNPGLEIDETEFSDLTLTYTPNDESYYIGFWVKNIDDDRSIQNIYKASNLQGGAKFANHNDPRTMGISFGVNF